MLSLARSLASLASLAALLAAADALAYDTFDHKPGCSGFKVSVIGATDPQKEINFDITIPGNKGMHDIPDNCPKLGGKLQFQSIEVCNDYKGLTAGPRKAPKTSWLGDNTASPVYASCEGAPECGPLVIHVTQRCNPDLILTRF